MRLLPGPPVVKEGWVQKPRKEGGWSERYAVLTDTSLALRRSPAPNSREKRVSLAAAELIATDGVVSVKGKGGNKVTFSVLREGKERHLEQWVEAVRRLVYTETESSEAAQNVLEVCKLLVGPCADILCCRRSHLTQ